MPKPKIDLIKLNQLLRAGKSVNQAASFFGVSASAISQAKKQLNVSVVKNLSLENAGRVVDKNLNAIEQLQKINKYANDLLDLLIRWSNGDEEAVQLLENQALATKDPRELALKAMAEIRNQLKLQLEIFQCLYDMKAVEEFQSEVLGVIGEVAPDVRDRIVQQLTEKRAIRRALTISQ
jgi:transposase